MWASGLGTIALLTFGTLGGISMMVAVAVYLEDHLAPQSDPVVRTLGQPFLFGPTGWLPALVGVNTGMPSTGRVLGPAVVRTVAYPIDLHTWRLHTCAAWSDEQADRAAVVVLPALAPSQTAVADVPMNAKDASTDLGSIAIPRQRGA
jgi:hypothetical protein